jgi:O-antigen/teichoic acid export membrane protein
MRLFFIVMRNSAFGFASEFGIKVLSFIFSVYIIRDLGAESYGQYVAVLAFGAIFTVLADLGLSPYAVRQIARYRGMEGKEQEIAQLYANVVTLRLVLSLFTALVIIIVAWLTQRPTTMLIAIAINTIGLILYSIQGGADTVLSGFEVFGITATGRVVQQLAFVTLGGALLFLGFGYYGLIYANIIGIVFLTIMCVRGVRRLKIPFTSFYAESWPGLIRAGIPFALIGFALGLSYKFDTILLNIFRGDLETGYYNAAYNLVFSGVVISNVLNTALYPSLTRRASEDPDSLNSIYEKILKYLLVISLPIAFGVSVLAGPIVNFLYTEDYAVSSQALRIVIWTLPLMYMSEFLGYVVVIGNKEGRVARAVFISTGVNVVMNLLLVPAFGFIVAAVMTVLTEAVLVTQHALTVKSILRDLNWSKLALRPLLAGLIMGLAVLLLSQNIPLFINIGIGAVIYIFLIFTFRVIGDEEFQFARDILNHVKSLLPHS